MREDCSNRSAEDPTKYPINTNNTIERKCVQLIKSPDIFIIIIFVSHHHCHYHHLKGDLKILLTKK